MFHYSLEEIDEINTESLVDIVDWAGSATHLSRMIGVSPATVLRWLRKRRVSTNGVLKIKSHPRIRKLEAAKKLRNRNY